MTAPYRDFDPDDRTEPAGDAIRTSVSHGVDQRAKDLEAQKIPGFGKRRRQLVDWPKGRRK